MSDEYECRYILKVLVPILFVCTARPGSPKALKPSPRDILEPVYMLDDYTLGPQFNLDDPDWHYVYVCTKVIWISETANHRQSSTRGFLT